MSRLSEALESGKFVVTGELTPPKGTDLAPLFKRAEAMKGLLDAVNLTDCHTARMTMSAMAVAHLLLDRGVEPIMQMTGRDRNRLALQSDLLGAAALGVSNVLCMSGDDPRGGDHPDARPVFDLEAIGMLRAISALQSGKDIAGNALKGAPQFFPGAVVNPGAPDLDRELRRMEEKIEAGAKFFQTQAVYDPAAFEKFMSAVQRYGVAIIAGFIMLKSGRMARQFNETIPGVHVPESLIQELDEARDKAAKSVEIAGRVIREIKPMCQGVHLMPIGWESRIPDVLQAAEISRP
ncbi:MAG: methylenetetrahydrofolate reductase [Chloroflexi bacterium]|nr:methylenetetrahydrofolate reductase [Chloroflexota bacterium]